MTAALYLLWTIFVGLVIIFFIVAWHVLKKKKSKMEKTDKFGNVYEISDLTGVVTLCQKNETRKRNIGRIYKEKKLDGLVFKKIDKEEHIHRKTNSWSIPYEIWIMVEGVWIQTKEHDYWLIKKEVENKKEFLHFLKAGTELKVYINLELWNKRKRITL